MTDMGRPKVYQDLPPRMTARRLKSGRVLYYYQAGKQKIPLGPDLGRARVEWANLENSSLGQNAFRVIAERFRQEEFRKKKFSTQKGYECYYVNLLAAFGHLPFEAIRPMLVRQYLDKRSAKIGANREVSLLSSIWKWAREKGLTDAPNQCAGITKNSEKSRDRYVNDQELAETYARSAYWLQDALDLAILTGQREGDILKMTRQDIREGHLWVTQDKTGARLGIEVSGALKEVLERILTRPREVSSIYLVADEKGQRITAYRLWYALNKAKKSDWTFHDLRAKAASDLTDIKHAQQLLGHRSERVTADVYRRLKGIIVKPAR